MNDNNDKNLNIENAEDSELEQVSGGEIIPWKKREPKLKPTPQSVEEKCCDFYNTDITPFLVNSKELYPYCKWCINWHRTYCLKGHF